MRELTYTGRWAAEFREGPAPVLGGDREAIVAPGGRDLL